MRAAAWVGLMGLKLECRANKTFTKKDGDEKRIERACGKSQVSVKLDQFFSLELRR